MADKPAPANDVTPQGPTISPEAKKFSLMQLETQMLIIMQNNQQAIFSAYLSTIANGRLAYPVTNRTQFILDPELKEITIQELPPEEVPATQPPSDQPPAPETPTSPVVPAN